MKFYFRLVPAGGDVLKKDGTDTVRVDCQAPCGRIFRGVAFIASPAAVNPGIQVPGYLGRNGIKVILDVWKDEYWSRLTTGEIAGIEVEAVPREPGSMDFKGVKSRIVALPEHN